MIRRRVNCNNDDEIIQGLTSNDRPKVDRAVECLYKRSKKVVAYIGYKLGQKDKERANDVRQETIVAIYLGFKNKRFINKSLGKLIFQIAHNKWIDLIKKDRNYILYDEVFACDSVEERMRNLEIVERVHEYLDHMPEDCRKILMNYWVEGISLEQIARDLNKSHDSIRKRHIKCRKLLTNCANKK